MNQVVREAFREAECMFLPRAQAIKFAARVSGEPEPQVKQEFDEYVLEQQTSKEPQHA